MVRLAAATCLIVVGIPTSSGLRKGSIDPREKAQYLPPTAAPAHDKGPGYGDDLPCPTPFFPKDDIIGGPYPCSEDDVYALHGSCWWENFESSYDESYTPKEIYMGLHKTDECFCGDAPAGGCFCGKTFAKKQEDKCATQAPKFRVSTKCNQCMGSAIWAALKTDGKAVACGQEEGSICHPDCKYADYNILDMCAGVLTRHLNCCRKRVFPAQIQKVYKQCLTPDEKLMCDYEKSWEDFEAASCGLKKSNATSATTKSSTKMADPLKKLWAELSSAGVTLD